MTVFRYERQFIHCLIKRRGYTYLHAHIFEIELQHAFKRLFYKLYNPRAINGFITKAP